MLSSLPTLSSMSVENDMAKKSKRRSLLPQFNRKPSADGLTEMGIKEEDEETQGSESGGPSEDTRLSSDSHVRRGIDEDRKAMPPPSKLSRPVSMIPPRGASQFARTYQTQAPTSSAPIDKDEEADADAARAQSLAALTGTSPVSPAKTTLPESGLKRSGSSRLPQSPRVGAPVIPSRTTSSPGAPVIPSRTTSSRKINSHSRAISTATENAPRPILEERITRSKAQAEHVPDDTGKTSPPQPIVTRSRPTSQIFSQQTSMPPPSMMARGRPASQMLPPTTKPASHMLPPTAKPAFNTFQQHYSPVKSTLPKPPLPSARTSSKLSTSVSDEHENGTNLETAKLQIELLQLSLLHQASAQCSRDYTAGAKRKLSKQHTKLRKDYESIRATELVHQRVSNLMALESWCRDPSMLVENLQILSLVYSDLTSLLEEGSRHRDVLNMFELWMKDAEAPLPGIFIQALPDEWRAAHGSLGLKLRSIQRTLGVLPPPPRMDGEEGSGLQVVLKGCKSLVEGMLRELELMMKLEKELLARETNKIEEEVRGLVLDDLITQQWRPAWLSVA